MTSRRYDPARIVTAAVFVIGSIPFGSRGAMAEERGGEEEAPPRDRPASRPFYLSFTQGLPPQTEQVFKIAAEHADMATLHFDSGVPWSEALAEKPYPKEVEDLIASLKSRLGKDRKVYLAITPIAFTRDQKASYWGEQGSSPAAESWKEKPFDAPEVIAAYTHHCRRMIRELKPNWMAYGIEVNMLASSNPTAFGEYVVLARKVYETLKKENPDLPLFQTIQIDHYHENEKTQREVVRKLLPFTDYMALSCYPYLGRGPTELPDDWFASVAALAPSKSFAIAETGWPAETVVMKKAPPLVPVDLEIPMTEEDQVRYVRFILEASRRLDARFVVWFFAQDFDILYELLGGDQAPLWEFAKWWRDTGLVDGDGKPRKSLRLWDEWLKLPRR